VVVAIIAVPRVIITITTKTNFLFITNLLDRYYINLYHAKFH
jgi:hypothetical protein